MLDQINVGFIGFGNMGSAMAEGMLKTKSISSKQLWACARNKEKLQGRCQALGIHPCDDAQSVLKQCNVIILAVKPYQLAMVIDPLKDQLKDKIIISIAAGKPFAELEKLLPEGTAHLSTIPNTPISTGNGVIVCEQTHSLDDLQLEIVKKLFSPCAQMIFVETKLLSIAGTLSGCGPAFVFLMIEALADAGVKYGLDRATAYDLVSAMVKGSGALQSETKQHPGVLKDAVCSPKGTTIKGISALEENGFRSALIQAIDAIEQ